MQMMIVKKLGNEIVVFNTGHFMDVFWGKFGWKSHARFQRKRINGMFHWTQINGSVIPAHVQPTINKEVA